MFEIRILCREDKGQRDVIRCFGLLQRTFKHHLGAKAVGTEFTRKSFLVTITGGDVHDGGDTAAIFGTETTGVDIGIADDIGIEHREQTDGVERIVDHHAIEQHLVLDGRTATDIELTALVASEDDARHHLQVLGKVGLTAHARNLGDGLGSDRNDRGLGLSACLDLVGSDGHRFQLLAGLLHVILTVDALAFRQVERLADGVVTHAGDQQGITSVRDAVDVEIAILIGCTAKGGAPQIDIGKHHGLTRRLFIHEALDAVIVLGHGNHTVQQEKQC